MAVCRGNLKKVFWHPVYCYPKKFNVLRNMHVICKSFDALKVGLQLSSNGENLIFICGEEYAPTPGAAERCEVFGRKWCINWRHKVLDYSSNLLLAARPLLHDIAATFSNIHLHETPNSEIEAGAPCRICYPKFYA